MPASLLLQRSTRQPASPTATAYMHACMHACSLCMPALVRARLHARMLVSISVGPPARARCSKGRASGPADISALNPAAANLTPSTLVSACNYTSTTASSSYATYPRDPGFLLPQLSQQKQTVQIHNSSFNHRVTKFETNYLVYNEKVRAEIASPKLPA
eukprot:4340999-Pleurochrysis_carterae.AAC.3